MSTDWTHYSLKCSNCAAEGKLSMWSDDWHRWGCEFEGFSGNVYVTGPKDGLLSCDKCGSSNTVAKLHSFA